MKIGAIVCEYNPLHNGHLYLIDKAKKDYNVDIIIGIMSGSFVQRGEPAIINKFIRAKDAVINGIDLVVELPTYYSLQSAEFFANGSVKLLNKCNIIDYQIFGSECGSIESLTKNLDVIKSSKYKTYLQHYLNQGHSYTFASRYAIKNASKELGLEALSIKSNDILGIEYLKALQDTRIQPVTIKRIGSDYLSLSIEDIVISATSIRNLIKNDEDVDIIKEQVPITTFNQLQAFKKSRLKKVSQNLYSILKFLVFVEKKNMTNIIRYENGMENLIQNSIIKSNNWDEFISISTSKRYSSSRIRRFVLCYILGVTSDLEITDQDLYIRPLAFNENGINALKLIKDNSDIPIISKLSNFYNANSNKLLDIEIKATNLYNQINESRIINEDFIYSPQKIENS